MRVIILAGIDDVIPVQMFSMADVVVRGTSIVKEILPGDVQDAEDALTLANAIRGAQR